MNPWRWVDSRIRDVRLAGVQSYLESRGWTEKPGWRAGTVCFEPPAEGQPRPACVLPDTEAGDFTMSLTYFLTALSEQEDRHPVEILEDILRMQSSQLGVLASASKR